ncbi:hypothetical protein VB716_01345 [Synechococcus sp. CCY9201]|jgi:hypothetical protein|uniref:hypothetical protein n=1 Tax=unclassified Synechococcus TaxID=2626047 RepID=UPI0018CF8467|nr:MULTISPECIES: hypothetical protein [unclassified Synechococcus]MEA5472866.1 hypothetical protein [Synechococcus sp. CCY9201]QPN61354.1 hypothetical protein H8F24_09095 [Synechococcus sp. CBW1002]QPN68025.1 hypothetical protein H8F26_08030 [Synechococcus sp. CBW1006]CAK6690176.1 hypothetical protein IFHNHDMJ_00761 [Synechococcus sp. CBW1107]
MTSSSSRRGLRIFVAITPVLGAVSFALLIPLLIVHVSLQAAVGAAVAIGCLWFALMLRTSEMPGH